MVRGLPPRSEARGSLTSRTSSSGRSATDAFQLKLQAARYGYATASILDLVVDGGGFCAEEVGDEGFAPAEAASGVARHDGSQGLALVIGCTVVQIYGRPSSCRRTSSLACGLRGRNSDRRAPHRRSGRCRCAMRGPLGSHRSERATRIHRRSSPRSYMPRNSLL